MIVHYRMEDKYIHGVITTHVFAHHPCDGILIIDDTLYADKSLHSLLLLAIPEKLKLYFFGIEKALEHLRRAEESELKYYIILRNPLTALALLQKGYRYKLPLTCGQQPTRDDTISIVNGVALTEEEIEAMNTLEEAGVNIVLDPGGTDENVPWAKAKKAVENARKKRTLESVGNKNTSLQKTLQIMDCFLHNNPAGLSLSEIQQRTQIPFSTCYRLVDFLEQNGYLSKGRTTKKYALGWKLLMLASNYADTRKDNLLEELAPPYLRIVQEAFNESACIYVRVGPKMKCIVVAPSSHLLQVRPRLNRLWDIEANATGLVLTAHLPQVERREIYGKNAQIAAQLKQVAQDGYATSTESGTEGVSSISAPILGRDGEVFGALTLQGPAARFCDDRLEAKITAVLETAQRLSHEMQQAFLLDH